MKGFYGTRYQSGSFSLNNVGSDFHCLHRFPLPASFFHSPFKDSSSRKKVVNKKGLGDIMRGFEGIYWTRPCLIFQTLSLYMCCSSHMNYMFDKTYLPLILGVLGVTDVFMGPKHTLLFDLMQSVDPGRCLIVFTDYYIHCCKVTNNVVPYFPIQGFFGGATSLVFRQQFSQFTHVLHVQLCSHTFWLMALSVDSVNSVGLYYKL